MTTTVPEIVVDMVILVVVVAIVFVAVTSAQGKSVAEEQKFASQFEIGMVTLANPTAQGEWTGTSMVKLIVKPEVIAMKSIENVKIRAVLRAHGWPTAIGMFKEQNTGAEIGEILSLPTDKKIAIEFLISGSYLPGVEPSTKSVSITLWRAVSESDCVTMNYLNGFLKLMEECPEYYLSSYDFNVDFPEWS